MSAPVTPCPKTWGFSSAEVGLLRNLALPNTEVEDLAGLMGRVVLRDQLCKRTTRTLTWVVSQLLDRSRAWTASPAMKPASAIVRPLRNSDTKID